MFAGQPKRPYLAEEHAQARQLRSLGAPIGMIAQHLGVSKSTVSIWVRDIELLPRQKKRNLQRARVVRSTAWSEKHRRLRVQWQLEGRERARRGETLHQAGCMLYWAEGAKGRNSVRFVNSDGPMVAFFAGFLRECFEVGPDDFTFHLNAYTTQTRSIDEIEAYWLALLGLNRESARKHTVNHFPTSSSGRKVDKLPFGVCMLRVKRSTRILQHIYGAIQEYSGIDRPEWLDGPPRKRKADPEADAA